MIISVMELHQSQLFYLKSIRPTVVDQGLTNFAAWSWNLQCSIHFFHHTDFLSCSSGNAVGSEPGDNLRSFIAV